MQFHLLRSSLLLVGLLVLLTGCNNLMADDEVETGLPAFRHYIPNVSQEVPIGESLRITNLEITVTVVRSPDGRNDNEVRMIPPEGQRFFLVNVLLTNQGDVREDISPRMSFSLFDSLGQAQEWFPAGAGPINSRINPGAEMKGELTSMVAENAEVLVLIYGDVAFSLGEASGGESGSPG